MKSLSFPIGVGCLRPASLFLLLLLLPIATWSANPPAGSAATGRALFLSKCAICHKPDGTGQPFLSPKANLTAPLVRRKTDRQLVTFISNGFPPMPAWANTLSPQQIRDLVAFVRTLSAKPKRR